MATPPTPYKKYTKTIRARYTTACHITASRNQSSRPAPPLQGYASEHSTSDDDIPPHSPTTGHGTLLRAISPPRAITHHARLHLFRATHRNIPHLTTTSHHTPQRPLTATQEGPMLGTTSLAGGTHTRHCVTSTTSSRKPTHGDARRRRPLTKKY